MDTIHISLEELIDLPDYTVGSPPSEDLAIGAKWKIFSVGDVFVGEKVSDDKAVLKLAICSDLSEEPE